MRIIDSYGFAKAPTNIFNTNTPYVGQVVGSRMTVGYTDPYAYAPTGPTFGVRKGNDPDALVVRARNLSNYSGGSYTATVEAVLENAEVGLQATKTMLSFGFRVAFNGNVGSTSLVASAGLRLSDSLQPLSIVLGTDWAAPSVVGSSHYFEITVDRDTGEVIVYRDNVYLKTMSVSSRLTAGASLVAFWIGVRTNQAGGYAEQYREDAFKDIILSEIAANDMVKKVGPVVLKNLPVKAVNAPTWTPNTAGKTIVESFNDTHLAFGTPDAAPTTVNVTDTDANGLVTFDTTGISDQDSVKAIMVQVDALGSSGTSNLRGDLLKSGASEQNLTASFQQTFDLTRSNLLTTGFARRMAFKSIAATPAKTELDKYSVKLAATS